MNRADLDDFFARANDVLTDWRPSGDAMVARVPAEDWDDLAPRGDSYYSQFDPDPEYRAPAAPLLPSWIVEAMTRQMEQFEQSMTYLRMSLESSTTGIARWATGIREQQERELAEAVDSWMAEHRSRTSEWTVDVKIAPPVVPAIPIA